MLTKTVTVHEGEWLGDIPADWDVAAFIKRHNLCRPEDAHTGLALILRAQEAMRRGAEVYANHCYGEGRRRVYSVGMYDGWVFWTPRPCFTFDFGPWGERGEFYNLRGIEIVEPQTPLEIGTAP